MQQGLLGGLVVVFLDGPLGLALLLGGVAVDHEQKVVDGLLDHDILALEVDGFAVDLDSLHVHEVFERDGVGLRLGELDQNFLRDRLDVLLNTGLNQVVAIVDKFTQLDQVFLDLFDERLDLQRGPGDFLESGLEFLLKVLQVWLHKFSQNTSDFAAHFVVLANDFVELVEVAFVFVFLNQHGLCGLQQFDVVPLEDFGFTDQLEDHGVEVDHDQALSVAAGH